jgi:NAD(P)-dependent dehydrogenase (short-subunit alcohol dehydrogenase family)
MKTLPAATFARIAYGGADDSEGDQRRAETVSAETVSAETATADRAAPAALVTGASRGIGRAIALMLSAAGHPVVACARTLSALEQTVELAAVAGGAPVTAVTLDVGDLAACAALAEQLGSETASAPTIFVHCAGIARSERLAKLPLADWEESMRVNVTSAFVLTQALTPAMQAAGWGRIVTIGSLYSRTGGPFSGPYAASKHALLGLTRVLATELVRYGVTANCVIPGWTDTEMVQEEAERVATTHGIEPAEAVRRFLRNQPLGRMVTPAEVAALVGYLCSDAAAAITAQAINVDGGSLQS